ncbi:hypothetical protein ACOSQ3_021748 [Xanthoceras sorbifolium]
MLGTTYKMDLITDTKARNIFARICVKIDIFKAFCLEGVGDQYNGEDSKKKGGEIKRSSKDPFGPWMMVSYGEKILGIGMVGIIIWEVSPRVVVLIRVAVLGVVLV